MRTAFKGIVVGALLCFLAGFGIARLAELERSLISERTRAGVKAVQRRGVKFGSKVKLSVSRSNTLVS